MKKIKNKDLQKINGGGFSLGLAGVIGAGVVFLIGLIDGFVRPLKCN